MEQEPKHPDGTTMSEATQQALGWPSGTKAEHEAQPGVGLLPPGYEALLGEVLDFLMSPKRCISSTSVCEYDWDARNEIVDKLIAIRRSKRAS